MIHRVGTNSYLQRIGSAWYLNWCLYWISEQCFKSGYAKFYLNFGHLSWLKSWCPVSRSPTLILELIYHYHSSVNSSPLKRVIPTIYPANMFVLIFLKLLSQLKALYQHPVHQHEASRQWWAKMNAESKQMYQLYKLLENHIQRIRNWKFNLNKIYLWNT